MKGHAIHLLAGIVGARVDGKLNTGDGRVLPAQFSLTPSAQRGIPSGVVRAALSRSQRICCGRSSARSGLRKRDSSAILCSADADRSSAEHVGRELRRAGTAESQRRSHRAGARMRACARARVCVHVCVFACACVVCVHVPLCVRKGACAFVCEEGGCCG
jgi:hypothetical protein